MRQVFGFIIVISLVFGIIFTASLLPEVEPANVLDEGKIVLRLRYRPLKPPDYHLKNPYSLVDPATYELGECDEPLTVVRFLGTDWDGDIYFMDPLDGYHCILKRFDRHGKFKQAWGPLKVRSGWFVAVTKTGYVWVWLETWDRPYHFPIVVYKKGETKKVMDWREEYWQVPKKVEEKIYETLKKQKELFFIENIKAAKKKGLLKGKGLNLAAIMRATGWGYNDVILDLLGTPIMAGQKEIAISLYDYCYPYISVGEDCYLYLWILIEGDGGQVLDVKVLRDKDPKRILMPDGTIWLTQVELTKLCFPSEVKRKGWWGKIWLWKEGEEKGEPLIDRNKKPWEDWLPLYRQQEKPWGILDKSYFDDKGRIYLYYRIISDLRGTLRSGLIILNRQREILRHVTELNITQPMQEYGDLTLSHLPDGSGFYRIEYREREAVIYFHPLPR